MQFLYWLSLSVIGITVFFVYIKKLSQDKAFYIISCFFIFMSAFRNIGGVGGHEYNYRLGCISYINRSIEWDKVFAAEGGNYLLQWGLTNIFKFSQPYIFVSSLIANVLILLSIKKYSRNILMSLFLYVVTGTYIATMNISRQYMAVGIIFFAYRFIENRSFIKYCIMVIIAFWFHTSALIMIPMYFILSQKELSKWSIIWFAVAIVIMINFERIANVLIQGTSYEHYADSFNDDNAVNPIRILKDLIIGGSIIFFKNRIDSVNKNNGFLYNAVLLSLLISVVSAAYKYAYRFGCYFDIGIFVLLPQIFNVVEKRTRVILVIGFIVLFVLYGYINTGHGVEYHNVLFESLPYGTSYGAKYIR